MQIALNNNAPVEISLAANGQKFIQGYFTRFYNGQANTEYKLPKYTLRIRPHALNNVLQNGNPDGKAVELRYNHDENFWLGDNSTGLELSQNAEGGIYKHPMDSQDPEFTRVEKKLEKHRITGSSMKFDADIEWAQEGDKTILWVDNVTHLVDVGPVNSAAIKGVGVPVVLSTDCDLDKEYNEYMQRVKQSETLKLLARI